MVTHKPLHPGAIIHELLIDGAELTITELAERLRVNRTTLSRLINEHSGISPEMALRLSKLLPNTDMVFWMNLQRDYDIYLTKQHTDEIIVEPIKAA